MTWANPLPDHAPLPTMPLPLDVAHLAVGIAVAAILICGVLAIILARLSMRGREVLVVECPTTEARAVVLVQRVARTDAEEVAFCSRWAFAGVGTCDHACLRLAA